MDHSGGADHRLLLTNQGVRALCGGISQSALDRWQGRADLAFPKPLYIGNRRYWREAEILAWLQAREVAA